MKSRMKRYLSLVLSFILMLSLVQWKIAVPVIASGVQQYKNILLSIEWKNIKRVGKQINGKYACSCYALAYCRTLLDNEPHKWYEYNLNGYDEGNVNCSWDAGGYNSKTCSKSADAFKLMYDEICSGQPVIAQVKGRGSDVHYVAVVGVSNVSESGYLSESNFTIIDTISDIAYATENMNSVGYSLLNSGGYRIVYCTGTASVSFQTLEALCDHSAGYKTIKKADGKYTAVCKNCSTEFLLPELNSADAGVYKTTAGVHMCAAPYQDSRYEQKTPKGSSLTIIGSVENAYGNTWYKTEDGKWVYKSYVKKIKDLPASADKLTLTGAVYPSSLKVGAYFSVYGKITSSISKISEVTVGVYDAAGKLCTGKTVSVNAKTFDVFSVDRDVYFNKLSAGNYRYKITAKNGAGTSTLLDEPFSVGASDKQEYYFDLNGFLDGSKETNITGFGTVDVYINGVMVANDVSDYYKKWPTGTTFEINDIKTESRYSYGGTYNSSLSGKIDGYTEAILVFNASTGIRDGYYRLSPQCAPGSCLDSENGTTNEGSNVVINTKNGAHSSQCFYIRSAGGGYYTLNAAGSGMMLDVYYAGTEAGTNIQLWADNGTDAQLWQIIDQRNGYYTIIPKVNHDLAMDVDYAMSSDGTNVKIWDNNGTNAQAWKLEPVD